MRSDKRRPDFLDWVVFAVIMMVLAVLIGFGLHLGWDLVQH